VPQHDKGSRAPTHSPLRVLCSGCGYMVRLDVRRLQQVVWGWRVHPFADVLYPWDVPGQFNSDCALQHPSVHKYVGLTS
jgi:hypothetical protein